ncbi:MAG: dicarboxylate/amino acid:cation symporter [Gemmatimonadota bacterium]
MALVAGFAAGLAWRSASIPSTGVLQAADTIGTMWVNAIRMTVVPLVVSLIITGIVRSPDARSLGRLGARSMATFVLLLSSVALLMAFLAPWVFSFLQPDPQATASLRQSVEGSTGPVDVPGFASWLTSLVPVNPIRAAVDAAMLPLLVFTVLFALALRGLEEQTRATVAGIFHATGEAMLTVVRWVLRVAPIGIAALAFALGIRLGAGAAGAVAFYLVAHSGLLIIAIAVMYLAAIVFGGVGFVQFARAAAPAQAVAMTTRSSMAALPAMLDAAETKLGIPRQISGFLVPFAVSVFRMNQAVSWLAGGLFIAALYGLPFGPTAVATFAVACVAMSFSVPGIPSGSLFIITPFFPLVGLPPEGVAILIALDTVPDVFKTTLNVTGHLAASVMASRPMRHLQTDPL